MDQYISHRSWMYDRKYPRERKLKAAFVDGVREFVAYAMSQDAFQVEGGIRCPCVKCTCRLLRSPKDVLNHLKDLGFMKNYYVWKYHGEQEPTNNIESDVNMHASSSGAHMEFENFGVMEDMVGDALGVNLSYSEGGEEETIPNEKALKFYKMMNEVNKPLFEGSSDSKLSMSVRLLAAKSDWSTAEEGSECYTKMMRDATPIKDNLPLSFYEAKKLVEKLGLQYKNIDCCVEGCMLFYDNEFGKNDGALVECKFCNTPRYQVCHNVSGSRKQKPVPVKSMFYMPIIPRLQRLFASTHTAGKMTWHYYNKTNSGVMRHPCDGVAWKHFDRVHPDFAEDPRNVRLGLCSDGFVPYITASAAPYTCWPILVTPYNLPPEMCMSKPYLFLSCIVPGPTSPKDGIDVYLQPLIDDLKRLWAGQSTYDIARKENFRMRAALMWTINDFPAYGMLSGWSTHGRMACPHCMENTKAFNLQHGRKSSWFDCHRRFLPATHEFRKKRNLFRKDTIEKDGPPPRTTSEEVLRKISGLGLLKFPDVGKRVARHPQYGDKHHWTKRSIFWDLPYWKDNLLRHNLDVMHIEKNFCDNIIHTVMNVFGKTKDNEKARMDLPLICKRPDMELQLLSNGKYQKPKAVYSLTTDEAKSVCQWLKELRMPDGYCSNLSRCADVNSGRLRGMKSHDSHVFMERLLPIAFSSLPNNVINPLTEISQFFKDLCASTLKMDELVKMDRNCPITLCKLEQVFPPGFFDSMEHLPVHLAYEAWLGGPVQYRWMYPFERFMGYAKRMVKNKARVEGSICAAYVRRETNFFLSHYFPKISQNEVIVESEGCQSALSIFRHQGRLCHPGNNYWMNDAELQSATIHVMINCSEVGPYIEFFQGLNIGNIYACFQGWFKHQLLNAQPTTQIYHLRGLAEGPGRKIKQWHTYFVNGFKFHTQSRSVGKKTINSGVYVKGISDGGEDDFYGVIKHIFEVTFTYVNKPNKVVLFYCDWFDPANGMKIDPKHKTVDIRMDKRYNAFDPFILASKVSQVYYVPYPSHHRRKHGWCAAIKCKPRSQIETEVADKEIPYQDDEISHVPDVIEVDLVIDLVDRDVDGPQLDPQQLAALLNIDTDSGEESSNSRDNGEDENNPDNIVDDFYDE